MKTILVFLCTMSFVFGMAASGMATTIYPGGDGPGSSLQNVLDTNGYSGIDAAGVVNDALLDPLDSYWSITGDMSTTTLIIELAGWANFNTFGVYDANNPGTTVELFQGTDSAGKQAFLSIESDGSVFLGTDTGIDFAGNYFGYYLTSGSGITYYSDSALNWDEYDHMVAFQWTSSEYILAWEDLWGGGDQDYQDMVLKVESVNPIQEPATMLLLGSGLIGLGFLGRKRLFKK